MERLSRVETYLTERHLKSQGKSSIFYDTTDSNSFVNWFVNRYTPMKDLLRKMKTDAERQRRVKQKEISEVNAKYRSLKRRIERGTCDKLLEHGIVWQHSPSCEKCELKEELELLKYVV